MHWGVDERTKGRESERYCILVVFCDSLEEWEGRGRLKREGAFVFLSDLC